MIRKLYFFLSVFILFWGASCKKTDVTPAFLYIEEDALSNAVDVSDFNEKHGTNYDSYQLEAIASHHFPGIWLTVNLNDARGYWGVPCNVPLLNEELTKITIEPGFMLNGQSAQIPRYPFIKGYSIDIVLEKENSYTFSQGDIVFKYRDDVNFPLLEPFVQSTSFTSRKETGAIMRIDEDNYFGFIQLIDSLEDFDVESSSMNLYSGLNYTILEIDYKMSYVSLVDNPELPEFSVGIRYNNSSNVDTHHPIANFRYSAEWKKVYVNLSPIISRYTSSGTTLYNVRVNLNGLKTDDLAEVKFYFDNIKITTF